MSLPAYSPVHLPQQAKEKLPGYQHPRQIQQTDIYVQNADEFVRFWFAIKLAAGLTLSQVEGQFESMTTLSVTKDLLETGRNYGSAAMDTKVLYALAAEMQRSGNILGQYYVEQRNGKQYIIFKGRAGLRQVLTGTRYLSTHSKVVKFAVGSQGLKNMAKGGFLVTVIFSVSLHSVDWLFEQEYRWTHWLGNISADIVKASVICVIGYLAMAAASAVFTVAIFPLAAGIFVAIVAGTVIDSVDDGRLAELLITGLQEFEAYLYSAAKKVNDAVEKTQDKLTRKAAEIGYYVLSGVKGWTRMQAQGLARRIIEELKRKYIGFIKY